MVTKRTTPSAKRMGRPTVADPKHTFSMRLNTDERAAIKAAAAELGLAETAWARMTLRRALGMAGHR